MRNLAGVRENVPLAEAKEIVELLNPVAHVHAFAGPGLELGEIEVLVDDEIEQGDLFFGEVSFWRRECHAFGPWCRSRR